MCTIGDFQLGAMLRQFYPCHPCHTCHQCSAAIVGESGVHGVLAAFLVGKEFKFVHADVIKNVSFFVGRDVVDAVDQEGQVGSQIPQPQGTVVSSKFCTGVNIERRECYIYGAANGGWSKWGCWGECRNGLRQRHRICDNPIPTGWGKHCVGIHTMTETCGCAATQDIIFVIDQSGSIGQANFNQMVNQVNSVIQLLDLDNGSGPLSKVRVGIELFNHGQSVLNHLNNFVLPTTPYPYNAGGTNIAAAISYAHQTMFSAGNGDRIPHIGHNPNTMVVITDGQSSDPVAAATAAKNDGIKIIAVGVGPNVNLAHLQGIVSDPSTDLFRTNDFCSISNYLKKRFDCDEDEQPLDPFARCISSSFTPSADAPSDTPSDDGDV